VVVRMDNGTAPRVRRGLPLRVVATVRRDIPLAILDVAVVLVAYLAPLVLRFDGAVPGQYWDRFWVFIPAAALLHLLTNFFSGLYGQMWRYASVQEARRVVIAGVSAGGLVAGAGALIGRSRPLPLSVMMLGATLSLMAFGAIRFQNRLFAFRRRSLPDEPTRVLLVGAGDAAAIVLKDIIRNSQLGLEPVAIVDDDPRKIGRSLHGVPVLGPRSSIPPLVAKLHVSQVLLAMASATGDLVSDVAALCEEADVPLRVLPSVHEIVGGRRVTARDIRDLRIEDLLGRKQVETDLEAVAGMLQGRRVLVTGAGGSIGSEIARQVLAFRPASLLLLDHDETHLFDLEASLRADIVDLDVDVRSLLADIRDRERILEEFNRHEPDVVFHAAAHKHVPILEVHPEEAVKTNVLGATNVVEAAVVTGVERLVFISTDKAVNPVSVMGISKRLAERIVLGFHGFGTVLCAVRFGNVLGSRGSVIPTFLRQIGAGGPVTVTDPTMTRYFMSVQEAVQLVLQAGALSSGGEVFTLDMGEPVNILSLAKKLIRLSGHVPERDIRIVVTGPRPGEKLAEELVVPDEESVPSAHPSIVVSRPPRPELVRLRATFRELETLARDGRREELTERMRELAGQRVDDGVVADLR